MWERGPAVSDVIWVLGKYMFNVMGTGPIYYSTYYMEGWPLYLEHHIGTGPAINDICELHQYTSKYYAAIGLSMGASQFVIGYHIIYV